MEKMKIFLIAAAFSLVASTGFACHPPEECVDVDPTTVTSSAGVVNGQGQIQDGGGITTPTSMFAGAAGAQGQFGLAKASEGSKAWDSQSQEQGLSGSKVSPGFGTGVNGTGTYWNTNQLQNAKGSTIGSEYKYVQAQGQIGGAAGIHNDKGTFGAGGSAYAGAGISIIDAAAGSRVDLSQKQSFEGGYSVLNNGPTGYTLNEGTQSITMRNHASVAGPDDRIVKSSVGVLQAGGTIAVNDGTANRMAGGGAAGAIGTATGGGTIDCEPIKSGGSFTATQEHTYTQASFTPNAFQTATGTVGTKIQGNTR